MGRLIEEVRKQSDLVKEVVGKMGELLEANRRIANLMEQAWQEGAITDEKPPEAYIDEHGYIRTK
jgi:hypothetical protein